MKIHRDKRPLIVKLSKFSTSRMTADTFIKPFREIKRSKHMVGWVRFAKAYVNVKLIKTDS